MHLPGTGPWSPGWDSRTQSRRGLGWQRWSEAGGLPAATITSYRYAAHRRCRARLLSSHDEAAYEAAYTCPH